MIKCEICNKEAKMITNTHLKSHNMTVKEYVIIYPNSPIVDPETLKKSTDALSRSNESRKGVPRSDEVKNKISNVLKGRVAHNKGVAMEEDQKKLLSKLALERSSAEDYVNPRKGTVHTEEAKQKIKEKRKNQVITKESVEKAINTKIKNGYDLAFFRGRTHTDESKKKISEKSIITNKIKTEKSNLNILDTIEKTNLKLLNNINEKFLLLCCNMCNNEFARTKQVFTDSKYKKETCPFCYPRDIKTSKGEEELYSFIKEIFPSHTVLKNDRTQIRPLELDVFIPHLNIAIEYCGIYWHSELEGKTSDYHVNKLKLCNDKEIQLITVFEDEWIDNKNIVKSILKSKLGLNTSKIFARKCIVKEITKKLASSFLNMNHIQGNGRSNICLGLYSNDELVSVMTFNNSNISRKRKDWEINRFCSISDTTIIGGAGKLFKYFIKLIDPVLVISYSDLRWGEGNVYNNIGFTLDHTSTPNYWYFEYNSIKRIHRYSLRKNESDDQKISEWENRQLQGWNRIWDCGNNCWIWKKKGEL